MLVLPRHLPQAARPDWAGTLVSRRLKLPKQEMSPVPLVRLVLLASLALSVPPGGSFASSDPKRIAAGRAQRRLVFRILLAAWLPPAVVLVRQPQPGIAARTVASWPDRWAVSAERLVRSAQLAWVVRHTLLARAAQTVWAVWLRRLHRLRELQSRCGLCRGFCAICCCLLPGNRRNRWPDRLFGLLEVELEPAIAVGHDISLGLSKWPASAGRMVRRNAQSSMCAR